VPYSIYSILDAAVSSIAATPANAEGGLNAQEVQEMMSNIVALMGISFILGVLFTTFILLIMDFIRRNKSEE
jgi:hypothetical protein